MDLALKIFYVWNPYRIIFSGSIISTSHIVTGIIILRSSFHLHFTFGLSPYLHFVPLRLHFKAINFTRLFALLLNVFIMRKYYV